MTFDVYIAYLVTVLVLFAHPPGPSQLLYMAHALQFGMRPATATMIGDLSVNSPQIRPAGFGLVGVIAASSADDLTVVRWLRSMAATWISRISGALMMGAALLLAQRKFTPAPQGSDR